MTENKPSAIIKNSFVLKSTEIFGRDNRSPIPGNEDCHALATTDYMDLLWTTLAEFPGTFPKNLNTCLDFKS